MQQLRSRLTSLLGSLAMPQLKKRTANSWAAVQDTYFSTKDTFERHKVVFTIGTSIASVATACIGYSLRHYHDSKVQHRLESIERALENNHHLEHEDFKKLVGSGNPNYAAWIATAGTTFVVGYGLGWRGGRWYANRKFRLEQMKLLGQIKPRKWQLLGNIKSRGLQLQFLRRTLQRHQRQDSPRTSERILEDASSKRETVGTQQSF